MPYDRRSFAGGAASTTLTAGINASVTTVSIASATGWPDGSGGDFFAVIDRGTASEEKVRVDTRAGTTLTLLAVGGRGVDGTAAVTHALGAAIELCVTAVDLDEANAHLADTTLDHHTQYLNNARHDTTTRHAFGAALGTPAAAADIGTAASAGVGTVPSRSDHVHKIGTGAINAAGMFAAGVVDAAAIATDAVGSAEIAAGAVTAAELASDAVTTAKILDANVTTAKIADANVTAAKLATALGRTHIVADAAALAALTGLREGDIAYQADTDAIYTYTGAVWVQLGGTPTWAAPTFANSWVNYGAPYQAARYTKVNGIVYLEGVIKSGVVGSAAFTLPAGFRPAAAIILPTQSSSGSNGLGRIDITSAGVVTPTAGDNSYFSISCSFVASA